MQGNTNNTQASYDLVAEEYTDQYLNEFDHKPLDCELLDRFASRVTGSGRTCDIGCGPGSLSSYTRRGHFWH